MTEDLAAGPVTLVQLLRDEREFHSPLFQRQFVWGRKQIGKLWSDVDELIDGEESSRFLGALVLRTRRAGLAFEPNSYWIVDGQQRLTTLYLTLLSVAVAAEKAKAPELADLIAKSYLFNQVGTFKNHPKLLPTLLDYRQFDDVFASFKSVEPILPVPFGEESGAMKASFNLIGREVAARCKGESGKFDQLKAQNLLSKLLERLKFVQIILGDDQDPHQVYDALNDRGVRLTVQDLVRNEVFQRLEKKPEEADALHRNKWAPMELQLQDRFDGYFFPFTLIHRSSATKSTVFGILRERWKDWSAPAIIEDVKTFIPVYNALTDESGAALAALEVPPGIRVGLDRLRRMGAPSSIYAYVLKVVQESIEGTLPEGEAAANLSQIESFLVRRAFAGYEPTGLHAVFKGMWADSGGDVRKLISTIDRNPTIEFPGDAFFEDCIKTRPLYGRRLSRYIVLEYERGLSGGDSVPVVADFSIDHVMPQDYTGTWRESFTPEEHRALLHTWANLVPLTIPANSQKGTKSWADVQAFFKTETIFKTTKRLAEKAVWDKQALGARSEELAAWALKRWPKLA